MPFEFINYNGDTSDGRRRRREPEAENESYEENRDSTEICNSCNESGHSRRSSKRCRFYRAPQTNDLTSIYT